MTLCSHSKIIPCKIYHNGNFEFAEQKETQLEAHLIYKNLIYKTDAQLHIKLSVKKCQNFQSYRMLLKSSSYAL